MDLITQMDITLSEALTGFKKNIKHFDGRDIIVVSPPGNVVKHEDVRILASEGMPKVRLVIYPPLPLCYLAKAFCTMVLLVETYTASAYTIIFF
jgi:hypothetical protein